MRKSVLAGVVTAVTVLCAFVGLRIWAYGTDEYCLADNVVCPTNYITCYQPPNCSIGYYHKFLETDDQPGCFGGGEECGVATGGNVGCAFVSWGTIGGCGPDAPSGYGYAKSCFGVCLE